ncbi:MAG: thioredoxin domain-containing protein [Bizionia sp.]|nr:thioredoxin domain-containing protein [Bizionia sp.]
MQNPHTNALINETSPYLLQHAHNPVDWYAWNAESLERAKSENKLIIISVGYAACHWCHVMEHESFENEDVADIMNADFINIKVDREERPDIDQVYMNAVQLMTGQGGWPMNVIALPDGRPIWGGTYFKKEQWTQALSQIAKLYANNPEKLYEYAEKLEQGIKNLEVIIPNPEAIDFKSLAIETAIASWSEYFDLKFGGVKSRQKFMMPNNYHFLLRYAYQKKDLNLQEFVNTTLTKIAYGGVYDHVGGGFSRYAVDSKWHVPHFEKMLYDNGQLISLYADAYLITKNELYKDVITETLTFVARELTTKNGAFYSSLDADSNTSEGVLEEGAYYVWTKKELETLLKSDYKLFAEYYNINAFGYWEHKNYVLIRSESDTEFTTKHELSQQELNTKKQEWKALLLKERSKRETPRLDDKSLTSWNAIMLKGYLDAYRVLGDKTYLNAALKNAHFIINNQLKEDGSLYHSYKNGRSSINGFLEDYATTIEAFILAYEMTLDKKWLHTARDLTNYAFDHFYDETSNLFFFTSNTDAQLVSRSIEYRDNVIPASNSILAKNLFKLSYFFDNDYYLKTATTMLHNVSPEINEYPNGFSNWLDLMLNYTEPFFEVAIAGKDAEDKLKEFNATYIPNKLIVGSTTASSLPLLEHRFVDSETLIYVCVNKTCKLPVSAVSEAIKVIKKQD